jgi:hypothetical protein
MRMHCCRLCDLEMEKMDDEPDVGIVGHWYCHHCNVTEEIEYDYED